MEALIISLIVVSLYFTHKWFFRKGFHAAVDLIQDTMTKDSETYYDEAQPCWLTENCQGLLHYTSGRSICNLCNKFYKVPE